MGLTIDVLSARELHLFVEIAYGLARQSALRQEFASAIIE